jgi:hypothetical protein
MQVIVVRYARERGQEDAEQAAGNLAAAPVIANLEGLAWKIWTYNDAEGVGGGVYLLDSEAHAAAADSFIRSALGEEPSVSGLRIEHYGVDETLSAITRAPLGAEVSQPT